MTIANPNFSPSEFELRNFTSKYLTPDQSNQVALTESRVSGQLDFLAQMLGWSGDNYWTNLPFTVSQKRQLLGGSFGVYNSFVYPRVLSVQSWENIEDFSSPRVGVVEIERDDQIKATQTAYLGIYSYPIVSLSQTESRMVLNLGEVDDNFFTQINSNVQLKIDVLEARPYPFYRPAVGAAGDNSFVCLDNEGQLVLHPSYDTRGLFPYLFPTLFAGSTYYFDKPLFLSYTSSISEDIVPVYNSEIERWVLQIPDTLQADSTGVTAFLVWSYASESVPTNSTISVRIQHWVDPSDWNGPKTLESFTGAWSNKGAFLPFNLAFDSLGIHGFNENSSLFLPQVERELLFNDVVDLVYAQKAAVDAGIPGNLPPGKLWWNTSTGVLAVELQQDESCSFWVEVSYREPPEQELIPDYTFPDVAAFVLGQGLIPPNTLCVLIANITGLSSAQNVLGLDQPIPGSGRVYLYRQTDTEYWVPIRFVFTSVTAFNISSLAIPYNVPTYIINSVGLSPAGTNYTVNNLKITVTGIYQTVLVKENSVSEWTLFPGSILKFIANSSLFGGPLEGEMWWDYANANPAGRSAQVYVDSAWTPVNSYVALSSPPASLNLSTVLFYCDGNLLTNGVGYLTDDFSFTYSSNSLNGLYTFTYTALSLTGRTQFPVIEISDSLTSSFQLDITSRVFSGITYKMSPNVYDAEAPLRLWKSQEMQVVNTLELLELNTYPNPLVADQNNGPGAENWQRYFVRLPLDYERNGSTWQKTALICQNFAYYGSSIEPEMMDCPPEVSQPKIYEEICLFGDRTDYTYVYSEPFLYSTVVYNDYEEVDISYSNGNIKSAEFTPYDEFEDAELIDYDPLHNRLVDFSVEGYGNWSGVYLNINACNFLSGYYVNDIVDGAVSPVDAPIWDASIYKYPPTCNNPVETYSVDANNYKIGYAYFVADASAAEDGFFDPQQEAAWRFPVDQPRTLYMIPPNG